MGSATEVAPGVALLGFTISNVYLVGERGGGPWVVVDSGVLGHFEAIKEAAEERYGVDAQPEAIVLTHAHIDHYGSALALATYWDVPIYAHRMDLPYLTGKCLLPPADPTVGGAFSIPSRLMPDSGTDLGDSVHALPDDGTVPGMPGWKWVATPGHTPGHVSLFRESDRVLIAGDAVLTVNMDALGDLVTKRQTIYHPPTPMTYDWVAVRRSVNLLASLQPTVVASGHGIPMTGPRVAADLQNFADDWSAPWQGRYVAEPALFDENGVVSLPPPVPDPLPRNAALAGVAATALLGAYLVRKQRKGRDQSA